MATRQIYVNDSSGAKEGTYGKPNSGGYEIPGGAPSYIKSNANMSGYKNANDYGKANNVAPSTIKTVDTRYNNISSYPTGPYTTKGSTGSTGSTGGGGGEVYVGGSAHNVGDDIITMIKNLLNEQKQRADEYYKTLYEQQLTQNKQADESQRNQANLQYMRENRLIDNLYGKVGKGFGISGQGLSNRVRSNSNWNNKLASIRQNTANNNASALAQYNSGLANNASTLAQGWYNYVLPVYTNRQQWLDNLAYRNM